VFDPLTSGFGFTSVGSGKAIAVDAKEMAKTAKMLADDTDKATTHDYDYDEQAEPVFDPLTSGFGFTSAGSGKAIAVDAKEMAKAAKMLADDTDKATTPADDYDEQAVPVFGPLTSGFGFTSVGSGKAIAVDAKEMAKAAKMLADDTDKANTHDYDYDEQAEPTSKAFNILADLTEELNANVDLEEDIPSHVNNRFGSDDFEGGKSTQKVRFSLEGNTLCVDASLEENSLSSKLACLPSDSLIQSLVTPAKTSALHQELHVGGEFEDHVKIVTDNKDKIPAFNRFLGGVSNVSSPCDSNSNAYTPLNATHRRDSLQSEIKSKRLFESTSSSKKSMHKRINSDGKSVALGSDVSTSTKVTLRQLAERCKMETEWGSCKDAGVSDVVLKLTSVNALKLRFSQDEGLPSFFLGQRAVAGCNHVGTVDDIYKWLVEEGFDESLFTKKWIQNHYRWIVWKLGSSKFAR